MSGKVKRVEILKNEAQSDVEYSDKNSCFELQFFAQVALENFLQVLRQCYGIREFRLTSFFASVKNDNYTMHQSYYMSGKVKRVEI